MARNVAIGIQEFEKIIKSNSLYIDKTDFIKEWWDSADDVTLITRPRRFGKTLNMSMIEHFFSVNHADRGDLFEGLSIWQHEDYRQIQGTYPVISLSFASIKEDNYISTKEKISQLLTDLYLKNDFLLKSDVLPDADKSFFNRILEMEKREIDMTMAIHQLSKYLYNYYGKKTIIILDEYDTPMQEAYINGYWDELVTFTRSLFNSTFKTNPYMERALMTGILDLTRVKFALQTSNGSALAETMESIFSDFNNPEVVTVTSDKYATCFGFTEKEVFDALDEYGLSDEKEQVKAWYDGFIFGEYKDIYNPWSILNFLDKKKYTTYWANTSGNRLVGKLLCEGNKNTKMSFESLLKGETITSPIDEQIVYNRLGDNEAAVWSLLLASGYLKVLHKEKLIRPGMRPKYTLSITNGEVMDMFYNMVHDWFRETEVEYNDFVKAMLNGNLKEMNIYMNRVSLETFSFFDTGKRASGIAPERFYHGFVLGLIADLSYEYIITSNRESGYGRYDVMIEPKDKGKNAFILEFKINEPDENEETLKDTVQAALDQINEKQYEANLIAREISKDKIYKYGFAFKGKEVLIGMEIG